MENYVDCKMSKMNTTREENLAVVGPTHVRGTNYFNIIDMRIHEGREHYEKYHDIYNMFQNNKYSFEN